MKCMGFQIVFNILTIKKPLQTDWPNTFSTTTQEKRLWRSVFGRITETTIVHHVNPKIAHQ